MDKRIDRMAQVLVNYSTRIEKGDRVFIEAEPSAEPLVRALFEHILIAGGHPLLAISFSGLTFQSGFDDVFFAHASDEQLDYVHPFYQMAYQGFEARIRIWSQRNTKAQSNVERPRLARRKKALDQLLQAQFTRGDRGEFRWVTTIFPTEAYAQDAEMSLREFEKVVFRACHVEHAGSDPVRHWEQVREKQQSWVERLNGHDQIVLRGPNCDLRLSVKGRTFINACGRRNMPDGEIFSGPVENSADGWIRFDIPSVLSGNEVAGVELEFSEGRVVKAQAEKNQTFLLNMLETDSGARYLGEFAIGTNTGIQRPTRNILLDEKIGGTVHLALGAGYPKTGSQNKSAIHWDFITAMRDGAEILVDGETVYRDGDFLNS